MYGKCTSKRSLIRKCLQQVILEVSFSNQSLSGLEELLQFYNIILKGVSLPMHDEHVYFVKRCVLPLLKKKRLEDCFTSLNACFRIVLMKDDRLGVCVC